MAPQGKLNRSGEKRMRHNLLRERTSILAVLGEHRGIQFGRAAIVGLTVGMVAVLFQWALFEIENYRNHVIIEYF